MLSYIPKRPRTPAHAGLSVLCAAMCSLPRNPLLLPSAGSPGVNGTGAPGPAGALCM